MPSRPADVDFPEISLVRWIGSVDDGQVLVVRTELRQRERQLRSPGLFTLQKSSGVNFRSIRFRRCMLQAIPNLEACYIHVLTPAPLGDGAMQER